jgi:hypothetical protein
MKDDFRKKKKDDEVIEVTITDDGFVMKDVTEAYKVEKKNKRRQQVCERLNDSLKFICKVGLPLLIAVGPVVPIIVLRVTNGISRRVNMNKEKDLKELYVYDRSLGHYWKLKRRLSNKDWASIDKRYREGERLADILNDLDVIK